MASAILCYTRKISHVARTHWLNINEANTTWHFNDVYSGGTIDREAVMQPGDIDWKVAFSNNALNWCCFAFIDTVVAECKWIDVR